jgi:hypothetical protein
MAFSDEPAEGDVALLHDLFGIPRVEAINRLKVPNTLSATDYLLHIPELERYDC